MSHAIGASDSKSIQTHTSHQKIKLKNSSASEINYILVVMEIMNSIGMSPLEDIMQTMAKMMDVTAQIQADFTTMQEYFTKIENLAHSNCGYFATIKHEPGADRPNCNGFWSPNSMNGLAFNEFHFNQDPEKWNENTVAPDFLAASKGFLAAFKDVFCVRQFVPNDPSCANNFMTFKILNKNGETQTFDLTSTYYNLDSNQSGWGILNTRTSGKTFPFGFDSHTGASLLQQYTFYKYKLAALTNKNSFASMGPNPDPSVLGVYVDPSDSNCDGVIKSLFTFMTSLDTKISVSRGGDPSDNYSAMIDNTSANILSLFGSPTPLDNHVNPDDPVAPTPPPHSVTEAAWEGYGTPGFLGSMAFAAFNYFWEKNPNASTTDDGSLPHPPSSSCVAEPNKGVVGDGDKLSVWYSNAQSSASLIASSANENSTSMQQYTSEVSQYQNIGQNIIKSGSENIIATVQNYKSA